MGLVREGKHQMSFPCPQEQPRANRHCCKHVSITINGHENGRAGCILKHRTPSSLPGLYKHGRVTHLFLKTLKSNCHSFLFQANAKSPEIYQLLLLPQR